MWTGLKSLVGIVLIIEIPVLKIDLKLIAEVYVYMLTIQLKSLLTDYTLLYRSTCNNNSITLSKLIVMGSSHQLKHVYKVTGKNTSASNTNLMKFENVELRTPTRDKRIWVIGMAEAGITLMMLLIILVFIKELLTLTKKNYMGHICQNYMWNIGDI